MALKTMSVEKLQDLKSKVEAAIHARVNKRRQELESALSKLGGYEGGRGRRGGARATVAAKYRNPENPSETWAGRGLAPRWLAAQLKAGKKKEEFLIAGASKASAAKQPKKTRKKAKK